MLWLASDRQLWLRPLRQRRVTIRAEADTWYSSEVIATTPLGHGRYTLDLASPVDRLDANVCSVCLRGITRHRASRFARSTSSSLKRLEWIRRTRSSWFSRGTHPETSGGSVCVLVVRGPLTGSNGAPIVSSSKALRRRSIAGCTPPRTSLPRGPRTLESTCGSSMEFPHRTARRTWLFVKGADMTRILRLVAVLSLIFLVSSSVSAQTESGVYPVFGAAVVLSRHRSRDGEQPWIGRSR